MPPAGGAGPNAPQPQMSQIFIDDWFSLEPVGRIHLTMSFSMTYSDDESLIMLTTFSETRKKQAAIRCRSWTKGRHSPTQRRGHRAVRPQIRATAILQHYALCTLWRIPQVRCRHAVFGLQVHLPQEVLPRGGDQVYHTVERRDRSRRGETEPSHSASLRKLLQYGRKLVLSLRVRLTPGPQAGSKVRG